MLVTLYKVTQYSQNKNRYSIIYRYFLLQEIKSRGGKIVAVVAEGDTIATDIADYVIQVSAVAECLTPIVASIPLQLLAYHIAVNKGRDVDKPRNLAKSVTVE